MSWEWLEGTSMCVCLCVCVSVSVYLSVHVCVLDSVCYRERDTVHGTLQDHCTLQTENSYIGAKKAQGNTEQSVQKVPLEAFTSCTHCFLCVRTHTHTHTHTQTQTLTCERICSFYIISHTAE